MTTNIYAALEIGTTRTVLAVGEAAPGERLKINCHSEIPSTGVRKSQILDIAEARHLIASVLKSNREIDASAGLSLRITNAALVVSGQHVQADPFQGTAQIEGPKVTARDIDEVVRSAHGMKLAKDRELLDIAERFYGVDSLTEIGDPQGMSGRILKLDTLYIHADANRINDARTAADEAHIEISDPLFAATCAADAVLTETDRRNGTLVLDLGGGCTGYAAYLDGVLALAGVIGVGGDHVTNDIAHAFQTSHTQADQIKIESACAIIGANEPDSPRVKVPCTTPLMEPRTISRHALDTVVNVRLRELCQVLRERLEEGDLLNRLHGAVITGGGAALRGIDALIQRELGLATRIGAPIHVDGLENVAHPESFAAIAGALLYVHRNYEDTSFLRNFFRGFFK